MSVGGGGGTASSAAAAAETAEGTRDEPEDLSTTSRRPNGDRSPSANGGGSLLAGSGRPTDHSIATIMKNSPTGVGSGPGFADADGYDGGGADGMRVVRKKQRVEDIVHSIYPRLPGHGSAGGLAEAGEWRRRKNTRKQVQPQQHGNMADSDAGACSPGGKGAGSGSVHGDVRDRTGLVRSGDNGELADGLDNDYDDAASGSQAALGASVDEDEEKVLLRRQLSVAIKQLHELRARFRTIAAPPQRPSLDTDEARGGCSFIAESQAATAADVPSGAARLPPEWQQLLAVMRDEIKRAVSNAVNSAMEKFAAAAAAAMPSSSAGGGSASLLTTAATAIGASAASAASSRLSPLNLKAAASLTSAQRPSYLDINFNNRRGSAATDAAAITSADELLLLLPSEAGLQPASHLQKAQRKRTKVTDTRLSPRAARVLMAEIRPIEEDRQPPLARYPEEHFLRRGDSVSSSVAAAAYRGHSLKKESCSGLSFSSAASNEEDDFDGEGGGEASRLQSHQGPGLRVADETSEDACAGGGDDDTLGGGCSDAHSRLTSTLTPLHLRKAKLMFFYVRYPSSALLKAFFPDVRFNKNNTAQLVKWFSNFREFYYIQMEKYARQMFADGQSAEDVSVTVDSELYKVLNLHYNRSNQIEVPRSFRTVVQATLKEFLRAISTSRDQEQSWKKPIYKVIMRMDDGVPDFFKSLRWMEQLTD